MEIIASLPKWEPEYGADGRPLAEPFDKGLKELIPLPGVSASKATDIRMVRFKAYLAKLYRTAGPSKTKQERMIEVGERIEQMKREGIPAGSFGQPSVLFPTGGTHTNASSNPSKEKRGRKSERSRRRVNPNKPEVVLRKKSLTDLRGILLPATRARDRRDLDFASSTPLFAGFSRDFA